MGFCGPRGAACVDTEFCQQNGEMLQMFLLQTVKSSQEENGLRGLEAEASENQKTQLGICHNSVTDPLLQSKPLVLKSEDLYNCA
ncbi:hypothetical protein Y1Q_0000020 [Alligator mississippiensis]|uniref:Uncharacterized protein n=1 Tax=Alligator mississippiensis TaxID=8496 RepID=A0A151NU38_ALLMI|nr:hypothetical protein Y1Q_0000020 [Alligator mississippiensis]